MRYYPLAKDLGKLFLLALIPVLLIFSLKWDAILPIIIYLQLLLIWSQAEIGLRQHILFSAQFDPSFDIRLREKRILFIGNASKNPAYNVMVARMLDEQNKPIHPDNWKEKVQPYHISSLAPNHEIQLCSINDKDFVLNKSIEVSYTNQFGEWKDFSIKLLEDDQLLFIPQRVQRSGILLNTFEDLTLILKLIRYERHLKSQNPDKERQNRKR